MNARPFSPGRSPLPASSIASTRASKGPSPAADPGGRIRPRFGTVEGIGSVTISRLLASRARRAVTAVYVSVALMVGIVALVAAVSDEIKVKDLVRDPATLSGEPASDGLLTWVSAFTWSASLTVVLFGAWLLRRFGAPPRRSWFLVGAAAVTTVLAVDDIFLGHERLAPEIGIPEELLFVGYVVGYLAFLRGFRDVLAQTEWRLLGVALGFFAASLFAAFGPDAVGGPPYWLLPDTYTFIGVGAWFAYHLHTVMSWLDPHLPSR